MERLTYEERLNRWYREARIGLFLHWGMHTGDHERDPFGAEASYIYETVDAFEQAAEEAGWHADKWIGTAKRLRAKYMTLATFHCQQGYLKIWRSDVAGSPGTKRDYLQELLDAAEAEGIRIVIYINRDAKHAYHGGVQWLNRQAYRAWKGDAEIDITTQAGYLVYSLDVMEELIARYPLIAGFWFDGYHDKDEAQEVFARLHGLRDDLILINNDFSSGPVADEDAMSLEDFGKQCEPAFDLPSGTWVGPGDKEFAFKTKWDWWYVGEGKPEWSAYELNYAHVPDDATIVKQIVSLAGSSWNANLGYGPKIGGDFPVLLEEFTGHFERFMGWAHESVYGTVGGGYDQGGFLPGHWEDGAYGVTTLVPGETTHYLHVLTPPAGNRLTLADAGYDVLAAEDLRSGALLGLRQEDGKLTIDVPSWDTVIAQGDLVIKLTVAARVRRVPAGRLAATASSEMPYAPAGFVLNGKYRSCYRGAKVREWPQSLTLQLLEAEEAPLVALLVAQPESGAVREGGFAAPPSERIRAYEVHASYDGVVWGEPIAAGELRNQRGAQSIAFRQPVQARYVRLTAFGNYGGTGTFQVIALELVHG